jgi:hypothetical protein
VWGKIKIPVKFRENDTYEKQALKDKVKYCRIVRKTIRGKYKFYLQLVLDGIPPSKRNSYGDIKVDIDPSLRSITYTSNKEVRLKELAPLVDSLGVHSKTLVFRSRLAIFTYLIAINC